MNCIGVNRASFGGAFKCKLNRLMGVHRHHLNPRVTNSNTSTPPAQQHPAEPHEYPLDNTPAAWYTMRVGVKTNNNAAQRSYANSNT